MAFLKMEKWMSDMTEYTEMIERKRKQLQAEEWA